MVKQPPVDETAFHFTMQGRVDSHTKIEYGPNTPFWRNSMGQALSEFGITIPSFVNTPIGASLDGDMYKRFKSSFKCL